jgi:hypothetical protein
MVAIPLLFIVAAAVVLVIYLVTRHRERVMIVEKGLDAEAIAALRTSKFREFHPLSSLKWGMILVGVGLAVFIGTWLNHMYGIDDSVMFAFMLVFGGAALVIFYFVAKRRSDA